MLLVFILKYLEIPNAISFRYTLQLLFLVNYSLLFLIPKSRVDANIVHPTDLVKLLKRLPYSQLTMTKNYGK